MITFILASDRELAASRVVGEYPVKKRMRDIDAGGATFTGYRRRCNNSNAYLLEVDIPDPSFLLLP